uniref:BTB/POZ domain-containing protein n=1 Tax=Aegilops tauschii TaxID=37682 RepID=M8CZC1_AEGTA
MLLKDYPSRDCVHKVLDEAFLSRLDTVKELLGKYASPDFRIAVDSDEREAIQKLNLHSAVLNVKHLLWLIERMVDMRVADNAVKLWSEQVALAADLQKLLNDADMWRNMAPGLPMLVTRCTLRLAHSVMIGETLVPRQVNRKLLLQISVGSNKIMHSMVKTRPSNWFELLVNGDGLRFSLVRSEVVRMKLVKSWLPVLNVCRDIAQPMHSGYKSSNCQELEETFLKIISTLSVPDAQELLQQCLGFSTRNVDDCQHLVTAFKTWFRRASRDPQGPQGGED